MNLKLNEVNKDISLDIDIDLDKFNEVYKTSSIKSFNSIIGTLNISKIDEVISLKFSFKTNLTLISSLSLKEFKKDLDINETLYVTDSKDFESDDVFYYENEVDLDNLVFSLIVSSLPIVIHDKNEKYTENENYRVLKEEDLDKENEGNHAFDALSNLDL